MSVSLNLQPIEPRFLHALGSIDIILEDALDVPVFQLFWKRAVRGFPIMRRRDDWEPIRLIPSGPAPQMGELDHNGCAVLMTRVGEPPQPGNNLVLIGEDIVEDGRTVRRHRRRTCRHCQGNAGFCALDVIGAVQILRHPIFWISRFMRSDDDPVAQL